MGLDAYDSRSPGEWVMGVLDRLQEPSKWTVSEMHVGLEDDPKSERVSLTAATEMDSAFRARVLASNQCSCFVTVSDHAATWTLPLLCTRDRDKTTLTASIYDADLRSGDSIWGRIRSLLDLCFDLLLADTTEWLRFGIEGEGLTPPESSLFVVLSERTWSTVPEDTRTLLSPVVEERPGFRVVWCSPPPGTSMPGDFERHLAAVGSSITAG
jgi:hypothetical protein